MDISGITSSSGAPIINEVPGKDKVKDEVREKYKELMKAIQEALKSEDGKALKEAMKKLDALEKEGFDKEMIVTKDLIYLFLKMAGIDLITRKLSPLTILKSLKACLL